MNQINNTKFSMKHIDLVRALESTFSQPLLEQLSGKFGLSPEILRHVVGRAAPALVSALMASGASAQGATGAFAAIMSPQVNARMAEQFQELVVKTTGLKALEDAGQSFVHEGMSVGPGDLSDFVSAHTGIPTQAAYAMTSLVAAMLSGVLKHHILLEQGLVSGLPQLLAGQWPSIESQFTDALARVMRFDDAAAFRDMIPAQLRVLSGNLERAATQTTVPTENDLDDRPARAEVQLADHRAKSLSGRRAVFGLFALAISVVAIAQALNYFHQSQLSTAPGSDKSTKKIVSSIASSASANSADATRPASASVAVSSGPGAGATAVSGTVASGAAPAAPSAASDAASASAPLAASQVSIEEKAHQSRLEFGVNRVGAAILSATVASEAEKSRLLAILDRGLGAGHYTADVTITPQAVPTDWLPHIEALVPLMRISRADMTIDNHNIELGGVAGEPGSLWTSRMRGLFGPSYNVKVFDPAEAVSTATAAFRLAIDNLPNTGPCDAVDRVLNLQVIDFAQGSGHVPASATGNLGESAQLLKACAARGRTVDLTIESFSDNIGDARANLDLSTKRAAAVRAYLVQTGVPAASLSSQGYGVAQPVVGNLTERGRFANRRIVFAARP